MAFTIGFILGAIASAFLPYVYAGGKKLGRWLYAKALELYARFRKGPDDTDSAGA
jgi:hypothetical protein